MKLTSTFALAAAMTAIAAPATAQRLGQERPRDAKPQETADTPPPTTGATLTTGKKVTISREAQKAIVELQTAVNAKNSAAVPALLAAAQKVAKTPDDRFVIASLQTRAAADSNDLPGLKAGLAALEASGSGEVPDLSVRYAELGKRFQNAGQAAEATAAYEKAIALDASNSGALAMLAGAKDKAGQKAEAVALMQRSFAASKAKGEKIPEGNLKFAAGLAYGLRLPAASDIARDLVAAYPSATNWRDALRIHRDIAKPRGTQLLDTYRLAHAAGALSGESEYYGFASALADAGALAEAKVVLDAARSAPGVDVTKQAFRTVAAQAAKAPARAAIDAAAKSAATGPAMITAGDNLYAVGAYTEAAAMYRGALGKGADASLANLRLGMALARAGDKPGAETALKAAGGVNADVARFWLLWLASR